MLGTFSLPVGSSLLFSPETTRSNRRILLTPKRQVSCASVAQSAESLYEVLQVKHDASLREIKAAYRSLAKLYHPDAAAEVVDGGKEFIEIHEAYARLSDPETRAEYDMKLRLSSIGGRRRPVMDVRARAGVYTTRRWETDQCW